MSRPVVSCLLLCVSTTLFVDEKSDRKEALKCLASASRAVEKQDYTKALRELNQCIKLDPSLALAYDQRGNCYFLTGKFKEAVADYDRYLQLEPKKFNDHWRRGIALYYLGRYADGKKQFEGYEKIDTNDVENAVWHLMCAARKDDLATARKGILKIGKDRRVPMMEVYELFKGTKKPEEVMKAAEAGDLTEQQRKPNLFYAHLYLGLYHDLVGDKKKATEHLEQAGGKYKIGYMGEVARVHLELLKKGK